MIRAIILPICFVLSFVSAKAQTALETNPPSITAGEIIALPTIYYKFTAEGTFSQRTGPAMDSLLASVNTLNATQSTNSAAYENPYALGTGVRAEVEFKTYRRIRVGVGMGYNLRSLSESRSHNYTNSAQEIIDEQATINSKLHYLSPGGYISIYSRYFTVSGGVRWNVFMGGTSKIENNLPSFVSPTGNNYGVTATVESPTAVFTDLAGNIVSSDVQNGGYYRHYLNAYIQIRIQPFGEYNRPYLTLNYSPTSSNFKRNLNAADYTRILLPAIDPQALNVPSRLEAFSVGIGWSMSARR